MEGTLRRLIEVYWRELALYREVREHVARQRELIEAGCSYSEINVELSRKRDLLMAIDGLEAGIRGERELWRRHRHRLDSGLATTLMSLLAEVTALVETILAEERQNEILLTSRRRHGLQAPVDAKRAAASYRSHSRSEDGR